MTADRGALRAQPTQSVVGDWVNLRLVAGKAGVSRLAPSPARPGTVARAVGRMTRGSQQPIALRRRAARMRRIDRLALTAEVLENPLDHRRILEAGDHPQPTTAAPAHCDVDGKHALEALRPRQRPLPLGGRWLPAPVVLVGNGRQRTSIQGW